MRENHQSKWPKDMFTDMQLGRIFKKGDNRNWTWVARAVMVWLLANHAPNSSLFRMFAIAQFTDVQFREGAFTTPTKMRVCLDSPGSISASPYVMEKRREKIKIWSEDRSKSDADIDAGGVMTTAAPSSNGPDLPKTVSNSTSDAKTQNSRIESAMQSPMSDLCVLTMESFKDICSRIPCASCNRKLAVEVSRKGFSPVVVFSCATCTYEKRERFDTYEINSRSKYAPRSIVNDLYRIVSIIHSPNPRHLEVALTIMGFAVPNNKSDIIRTRVQRSVEELYRRTSAEFMKKVYLSEEPAVSVDGQHSRPQKKTNAFYCMTTFMCNTTKKIVHVEITKQSEAEVFEKTGKVYSQAEDVGLIRGLRYVRDKKPLLDESPVCIHDQCVTAETFILYFLGANKSAIDYFHKGQKLPKEFCAALDAHSIVMRQDERQAFCDALHTHWTWVCLKVEKRKRKHEWLAINFDDFGLVTDQALQLCLKSFLSSWIPVIEQVSLVEDNSTSCNEAFHGFSRHFWDKKCLMKKMHPTKVMCAVLSWNCVPDWPLIVRDATMSPEE